MPVGGGFPVTGAAPCPWWPLPNQSHVPGEGAELTSIYLTGGTNVLDHESIFPVYMYIKLPSLSLIVIGTFIPNSFSCHSQIQISLTSSCRSESPAHSNQLSPLAVGSSLAQPATVRWGSDPTLVLLRPPIPQTWANGRHL